MSSTNYQGFWSWPHGSFQSFLYRCIGVTLQQCSNKEVVQKQLQEMLISARHNDAIERAVKTSSSPFESGHDPLDSICFYLSSYVQRDL